MSKLSEADEAFIKENEREVSYGMDSVMRPVKGMAVDTYSLRAYLASRPSAPVAPAGCSCTFSKRMVGDGCRYCQPQTYIDHLEDALSDARADAAPQPEAGMGAEVEALVARIDALLKWPTDPRNYHGAIALKLENQTELLSVLKECRTLARQISEAQVPEKFAQEYVKAARALQEIAAMGGDSTDKKVSDEAPRVARHWCDDGGHGVVLRECLAKTLIADVVAESALPAQPQVSLDACTSDELTSAWVRNTAQPQEQSAPAAGESGAPSWDDAPEWAQWLAQDQSGIWWWYETQPSVCGVRFAVEAGNFAWAGAAPMSPHWPNTLQPRPAGADGGAV